MRKLLLILSVSSLLLANDISTGTLDKRLSNVEQDNQRRLNVEKQYDSFFDYQKGLNLDTTKLINEQRSTIESLKKIINNSSNTNEVSSLKDENDRLRSRINSLESTNSRLDDKIYRLDQRLQTLERKVR